MAGYWTSIALLDAPASVRAGETALITVAVKNLGSYSFYIAVTGVFDGTQFALSPEYATVAGGKVQYFFGSFTMPTKNVRVTIYSWYWTGHDWYQDDERYADVALAGVVSQFSQFEIADYSVV